MSSLFHSVKWVNAETETPGDTREVFIRHDGFMQIGVFQLEDDPVWWKRLEIEKPSLMEGWVLMNPQPKMVEWLKEYPDDEPTPSPETRLSAEDLAHKIEGWHPEQHYIEAMKAFAAQETAEKESKILEWIDCAIRSADSTAEEYIQELDNQEAAEGEFGKVEILKDLKEFILAGIA